MNEENACFQGCSYGGRDGGLYSFALDVDKTDTFKQYNLKRCRVSEYPHCACVPAASPPPTTFPPPPPISLDQSYSLVDKVAGLDTKKGAFSALVKRIVNARTIDFSFRQTESYMEFQCPGKDDGRDTCARNCAQSHISKLRAFTVEGLGELTYGSPEPPTAPPSPPPPMPPQAPFNSCQNLCDAIPGGDHRCRDGGYNSYMPALCSFAQNCENCGMRTLDDIVQDDSCPFNNNEVCEDGGTGSSFHIDPEIGITHLCGYGTDKTDCATHGERSLPLMPLTSFNGLTTFPVPTPPPPVPPPPPPGVGTPQAYGFNGCLRDDEGQDHCRPTDGVCSDGGFGSKAIGWRGDSYDRSGTFVPAYAIFSCDYGTQASTSLFLLQLRPLVLTCVVFVLCATAVLGLWRNAARHLRASVCGHLFVHIG